jgi:hypothetical protein
VATQQAPLDWRVPIVNTDGTPTDSFMRLWNAQRTINGGIITSVGISAVDGSLTVTNSPLTSAGVIDLAVTEAPKLTTARTLAMTGDVAWSVSFNGASNVTAAGTLATVNSNVGSFGDGTHIGAFTVNAKGLVTAASSTAITSAPKWTTARNIAITGDLAWNVTVDGSAAATAAGTLATVNSNVGSFGDATHIPTFTVNAKGLITAASSVAVGGGTVTSVSSANGDLTVATGTTTPVLTIVSAPKFDTARTLAITGDMTWSLSFDGSANVTAAGTLSTVNSNVGTFGDASNVAQVTVNAKGLVTAVSNVAVTGGGSGAVTLISEVVTSGSQSSVSFTSVAATYRDLEIRVRGRGTVSDNDVGILLRFNNDSGSNYDYQVMYTNSSYFESYSASQTSLNAGGIAAGTATTNAGGLGIITIGDYRGTTFWKSVTTQFEDWQSSLLRTQVVAGQWKSTSAINRVDVLLTSGAFVNGSVVSLYGRM